MQRTSLIQNKNDFYLNDLQDKNEILLNIFKAVLQNDKPKIRIINEYLICGTNEKGLKVLSELPSEIVILLNNFDCIYDYVRARRLNQEDLNQITDWVSKNGNSKQKERFLINIPYVEISRLDGSLREMTKEVTVKKTTDLGDINIETALTKKEIAELTEWAINNKDLKQLYEHAIANPYLDLRKIELALIKESILENNIKYIYKFAKNVQGAKIELLELGMHLIFDSMPEFKKFVNAKYLFHFSNDFGIKRKELYEQQLQDSNNLEYIAYQIIYGESQELLSKTFGNPEDLFRFSLSCKDFFEEKKIYADFLEKVKDSLNNKKEKVLKKEYK